MNVFGKFQNIDFNIVIINYTINLINRRIRGAGPERMRPN